MFRNEKEYIYGKHVVLHALEKTNKVVEIFFLKKIFQLENLAKRKKIKITYITKNNLSKREQELNHQSVFAKIKQPSYLPLNKIIEVSSKTNKASLLLILDGITDSHNFGAIIRNAAAFNATGIIVSKHSQAQVNSVIHKTSAGASLTFPICQVTNINQAIDKLKKNNYWIVGTLAQTNQNINELDKNVSYAIVLGSEGKGISKLTLEKCDFKVSIPISKSVESLNVSVVSAIVLYKLRG